MNTIATIPANETPVQLGCFYRARGYLMGSSDLNDLFYFRSHADAVVFCTAFGGWVMETTQGQIWRVSIKL